MALVKVHPGLYRTKDGRVTVSKQLAWRGEKACWAVLYTDAIGCRVSRKFAIFAEAKVFALAR